MALADDLSAEVASIFRDQWTMLDGRKVPDPADIALGKNDSRKLDATVLYADLAGSTFMVDTCPSHFAAEVYKSYLHCAAKIIKWQGGVITAYDGDRIMAVFLGGRKNTSAVRAGLHLNHAVREIINPALLAQYPGRHQFLVKQRVGIDSGQLRVARTGVRGDNDLVWVGRAANYAAKLTSLSADYPTRITGTVYDTMLGSAKFAGETNMWEQVPWTDMNDYRIYRSIYTWAF